MDNSIDDISMKWAGTARCTECGATGAVKTTDPNQDELWFDCPECQTITEHELVIVTDTTPDDLDNTDRTS